MPPLTAFQAWLTRAFFGDSLFAIRLISSFAGAALVVLTGLLARELSGGRFAQGLAALAAALAPVSLAFHSYLSMNALEPVIWMACALLLTRMIRTGNTRLWIPFGLLAGIGLLNKHTTLMFGFAVVVGLLLTPERRLLFNRWCLLGGALAFAIFLPNLVWMARHGWPFFELLANIRRDGRDVAFKPLQFLALQILFENPAALPIWVTGLATLLAGRLSQPFRPLGIAYLVILATLLASHGKVYYLSPIYPLLFAAGAVAIEASLSRPGRRWVRWAYAGFVPLVGLLLAPTALPVLSPETYLRYTRTLHIGQPRIENRAASALPQFFADRFGWPEMAAAVARVYMSLPAEERKITGIFGNDYGQAGAIDFYGPKLGLPKAIGGHQTYWYWGPREYTGESLIVLGDRQEVLESKFESVTPVAKIGHPYAMRQEQFTAFLCRGRKGWTSLSEIWPKLKRFN